jgi:hypothetical protein
MTVGALDLEGILTQLRQEVRAEVTEEVAERILSAVTANFQAIRFDPHFTVDIGDLQPPAINVPSPIIDVDIDLSTLNDSIRAMTLKLDSILTLLRSTLTRTVHRDSNNLITSITETRA